MQAEARFEPADAVEEALEAREVVPVFDFPHVGAAARSDLGDARGKAAVFGGEGIREHFHRFDALPRQIEIEITGGRIDEAGRAHLQRALRRLTAFDPQPPIGVAHDAGQHRHEALKSSPSSGALSSTGPVSMSLVETGCTLSVAPDRTPSTSTG